MSTGVPYRTSSCSQERRPVYNQPIAGIAMHMWVVWGAVHPMVPFSPDPLLLTLSSLSPLHQEHTCKYKNMHPVLAQSNLTSTGIHWAKRNHLLATAWKNTLDPPQSSKLTLCLEWCNTPLKPGKCSWQLKQKQPQYEEGVLQYELHWNAVCELLQWSTKELTACVLILCTQGLNSEHMLSRKRRNLE